MKHGFYSASGGDGRPSWAPAELKYDFANLAEFTDDWSKSGVHTYASGYIEHSSPTNDHQADHWITTQFTKVEFKMYHDAFYSSACSSNFQCLFTDGNGATKILTVLYYPKASGWGWGANSDNWKYHHTALGGNSLAINMSDFTKLPLATWITVRVSMDRDNNTITIEDLTNSDSLTFSDASIVNNFHQFRRNPLHFWYNAGNYSRTDYVYFNVY